MREACGASAQDPSSDEPVEELSDWKDVHRSIAKLLSAEIDTERAPQAALGVELSERGAVAAAPARAAPASASGRTDAVPGRRHRRGCGGAAKRVTARSRGQPMATSRSALVLIVLLCACLAGSSASAEPTQIEFRVISKGAKFIGTSMGGVAVTLLRGAPQDVSVCDLHFSDVGERSLRTEVVNGLVVRDPGLVLVIQCLVERPDLDFLENASCAGPGPTRGGSAASTRSSRAPACAV